MIIKKYEQQYEKDVVLLWNRCLDKDCINETIFRNKVLLDFNFDPELTYLAFEDSKLIGFLLGIKRKIPYYNRGLQEDKAWVVAIFVDKEYRRNKVATNIYEKFEHDVSKMGVKEIILAYYSPNYFFPGVDVHNYKESLAFFEKMKFNNNGYRYSMDKKLVDTHKYNEVYIDGFEFKHFDYDYTIKLLRFIDKNFSGGWKANVINALKSPKAKEIVLIVVDNNNEICGFSMSEIDGNACRFGPIGISCDYQNKGIGSKLLNYAQNEMFKRGIRYIYFISTDEPGKRFYERNGFNISREFLSYSKKI